MAKKYRIKYEYVFTFISIVAILVVIFWESRQPEPLYFIHPTWAGQMRFVEPTRLQSLNGDYATILEKTEDHILVNWDKYGKELFKKEKDGTYRFAHIKN